MHFRIRPPNLAEKDDRSKNSTISPFYSENCFKTTRVICGKSSNEISFKIFVFGTKKSQISNPIYNAKTVLNSLEQI